MDGKGSDIGVNEWKGGLTGNGEEDGTFVPAGLYGLAQDGGELGEGGMLELLEAFGLWVGVSIEDSSSCPSPIILSN